MKCDIDTIIHVIGWLYDSEHQEEDKEKKMKSSNFLLMVIRNCKNCQHDESWHDFDFESSWCEYGWWDSNIKKCDCKGFEFEEEIIKNET